MIVLKKKKIVNCLQDIGIKQPPYINMPFNLYKTGMYGKKIASKRIIE